VLVTTKTVANHPEQLSIAEVSQPNMTTRTTSRKKKKKYEIKLMFSL
jgi:hypothetical protein